MSSNNLQNEYDDITKSAGPDQEQGEKKDCCDWMCDAWQATCGCCNCVVECMQTFVDCC